MERIATLLKILLVLTLASILIPASILPLWNFGLTTFGMMILGATLFAEP